jgi:ATP synthase I chain
MSTTYERATRRILWVTIAVSMAGAIVTVVLKGPRSGAGFLAGSMISLLNLHALIRVVDALGGARIGPSAILFTVRFVLIAGAVYVIVKSLNITPAAVFAGLLVSTAAVMVEALYELITAK